MGAFDCTVLFPGEEYMLFLSLKIFLFLCPMFPCSGDLLFQQLVNSSTIHGQAHMHAV